jgi:hypothetical protein
MLPIRRVTNAMLINGRSCWSLAMYLDDRTVKELNYRPMHPDPPHANTKVNNPLKMLDISNIYLPVWPPNCELRS